MYFSHGFAFYVGLLGLANLSTASRSQVRECQSPSTMRGAKSTIPTTSVAVPTTTPMVAVPTTTPVVTVPSTTSTSDVSTTTLAAISTQTSVADTPSEKLGDVLSRAKLQYPESNLVALPEELTDGFSDVEFQTVDTGLVQFQVAGSSKRSELREMEEFGDEIFWGVEETHIASASILVPEQNEGVEEVTIMQVHNDVAPILRISWMESKSFDGVLYEDIIAATVRVGLGDSSDNFVKTVLGQRSDSPVDFQITVDDSKLTIHVDGVVKVDQQDLSSWDGNPTAYFKAGAYNNHPNIEDAVAVVYLESLEW
ncbi:alginate lyase-domain-containing protein [Calycina marina]|uniref:Alginate lyase-domain-containing protein n=1 Tax=Calycina marina TaxID=1763456 RepID=A0A9P8CC78_9HELO|nr:alginate lyase-domain-containing protein [Calycina marina]